MLINKTNVLALFKSIVTSFNKSLAEAKPMWPKIATRIPSGSSSNNYGWLKDGWPSLRKWIGDKHVKYLSASGQTIPNEPYESTIGVKRDDLEDDNYGIYGPLSAAEGAAAAAWPEELIADRLNNAFEEGCYDGQPFIDTDHPVGDGTVSNKSTKKLDITTLAKAQGSYGAARTAMKKLKNENARPLNIMPNLLVVPPALEDAANALMSVDKLEDGKPNPYKGTAEVMVWPYLTDDDAWFLMDTSKALKPLIFQERKKPKAVSQTDPASDDVFNKAVYKFSIEARGASGFGFWQLCHGSTGADA